MKGVCDLAISAPAVPREVDVCILGSGPVGLTLAHVLVDRGYRVDVLECGGKLTTVADASATATFDRRVYLGAGAGRAFGLGGTSALWGGQLLPVRPDDLRARPNGSAPAWPIDYAEIEREFADLQRLLGVPTSAFEFDCRARQKHPLGQLDFQGWAPRRSKWLAFGRRNLARAWLPRLVRFANFSIWVNCARQDWIFDGPSQEVRVRELQVIGTGGKNMTLRPRVVVIAAGALESARLVLEMKERITSVYGHGPDNECAGHYLHDHLSMRIAQFKVMDTARFSALFAPVFDGSTMRSLRMEPSVQTLEEEALPPLYLHIIAHSASMSGFALLRDLLRSLQRGDLRATIFQALRMPSVIPELTKMAYARFQKHRLQFAKNSTFYLHVDFEQPLLGDNRVYLGELGTDGRRRMHIAWDFGAELAGVASRAQHLFAQFWQRNDLDSVARIEFAPCAETGISLNNAFDIYHPAGTTRMGADPATSAVDTNLRLHGFTNAYVVGSSVFPSMGAANPTFTAMALAMRLARFLTQSVLPRLPGRDGEEDRRPI